MRLNRQLTAALAVLGLGLASPMPAMAGPPHADPPLAAPSHGDPPKVGHGPGRPGHAPAATGAEDQGAPTFFNSGLAPTPYQAGTPTS
ncbi:glycoside hydrolase family 27 protein, partial [Micromonospora sp. STR1s_5]|nr:glycoside hydrolase family 27 protein [Micromonospora sp. STR1s_5]